MAFSLSAATVHPTQLSPQAEGWRGGSDRVRWEPWEVVLCFCIFFISLSYITSTRSKGTFAHWSKAAGTPCKTKQNGKKQTTLFQVFPYIPPFGFEFAGDLQWDWVLARIIQRPSACIGPRLVQTLKKANLNTSPKHYSIGFGLVWGTGSIKKE